MEYSKQDSTKDKQTAAFIFNTYFWDYKYLKDDLIQTAVISLWNARTKGRKMRTKTGANKIAKDAMIDFLRKESRNMDIDSLDAPLDDLEDDFLLLDTLPIEQDTADEKLTRYLRLLKRVKFNMFWLNGKKKKIIAMYLNRRSYQEIADCVGISKQNVGACINAFRETLTRELGLNIEGFSHE